VIRTEICQAELKKYDNLIEEAYTNMGQPENVRKVAAFTCKGDFMYLTGQVIMVDGGLTILRL